MGLSQHVFKVRVFICVGGKRVDLFMITVKESVKASVCVCVCVPLVEYRVQKQESKV